MRAMVVITLSLFALAGCAQQRIETGMNEHIGKPASALFARLSYPDGRTLVNGQRAYVWGSDSGSSFLATNAAPSRLGTSRMTLATNTLAMSPVDQNCMIRVVVDSSDRIVSWDSKGNEGGCAPYARRLTR